MCPANLDALALFVARLLSVSLEQSKCVLAPAPPSRRTWRFLHLRQHAAHERQQLVQGVEPGHLVGGRDAGRGRPTTASHGSACETGPQRPDCSGVSAWMESCFSSIRTRAGAWGRAVSYLCLEESIESPARSGIGPARSYMGLRPPRSVQMASKFGGRAPPCRVQGRSSWR